MQVFAYSPISAAQESALKNKFEQVARKLGFACGDVLCDVAARGDIAAISAKNAALKAAAAAVVKPRIHFAEILFQSGDCRKNKR